MEKKETSIVFRSNIFYFFVIVLVAVTLTGLHSIHLTADTPAIFAPDDIGLRVDEGYKTLAPKNIILFGKAKINPADEYDGWFRYSPLTQSLTLLSFKIFGPDLKSARIAALLYYFFLVCVILWPFREKFSWSFLSIAIFLLAFEPFLFFFSRVALFEVAMALFVVMSLSCIKDFTDENESLSIVILIAFCGLSFFLIKRSAIIYFVPAIAFLLLIKWFYFNKNKNTYYISVFASVLMIAILVFTRDAWLHRLSFPDLQQLLIRFFANPFFVESPWLASASFLCIFDILHKKIRGYVRNCYFFSLVAILVGVPLLFSLFSYAPPRYYVVLSPVAILIVLYWLTLSKDNPEQSESKRAINVALFFLLVCSGYIVFRYALDTFLQIFPDIVGDDPGLSIIGSIKYVLPMVTTISFFLVLNKEKIKHMVGGYVIPFILFGFVCHGIYLTGHVFFKPGYDSHSVRKNLARMIEADQAVIGDWATFFSLGTKTPSIYATRYLNNGDVIFKLCPDHYLYNGLQTDDFAIRSYQKHGVSFEKQSNIGSYFGQQITLLKINYPQPFCE